MSKVSGLPSHVAQHCRSITRRRARNFYYGLKLLPEPRRTALYAVYAWMRKADDLVDNQRLSAQEKQDQLAEFRKCTVLAFEGSPPSDDPVWEGVAFVAQQFQLQAQHLHAMLDGQLEDVQSRTFDTFETLRQYCYKVASTVGLVCIEIWGYTDPSAREMAIDRGIAFQLTNIMRDLREDLDHDRVYLPLDELAAQGLSIGDLRNWSNPVKCTAFMNMQLQRAESYYCRSMPLDSLITPECRPTLWAMTMIYRGLLEKIKADPSQVVAPRRIRLSALSKAKIAVRAKWLLPTLKAVEAAVP